MKSEKIDFSAKKKVTAVKPVQGGKHQIMKFEDNIFVIDNQEN